MFKILECLYSPGQEKPTVRTVATRAKKHAAKVLADNLNHAQDLSNPDKGIKSYMVTQ